MSQEIRKNLYHNFVVNVLDGCFFGLGLNGLASYVTIVPLFLSYLTDSTALIGFMAAMFQIGWQIPQLFTSKYVAGLRRYKPMALWMTLHERIPFFALAIVAILIPVIGNSTALVLTIILLIWQSFGGGLTGTAWQSMVSKIMPPNRRGTFFGMQSAGANLFGVAGAFAASKILSASEFPNSFGILFLIAGISLMISFAFLAMAREPDSDPRDIAPPIKWSEFGQQLKVILRDDPNFRWFLIARGLSSLSVTAIAFFTIFGIREYDMTPEFAALLGSVLLITQMITSPLLGWLGDHLGHRRVFAFGNLLMPIAIWVALSAPDVTWFYVVFALTGAVNSTQWSTIMTLTTQFGTTAERPVYIGMSNTLIAPVTVFAPIVGGMLVDWIGFDVSFAIFGVSGLLALVILMLVMVDPNQLKEKPKRHAVSAGD